MAGMERPKTSRLGTPVMSPGSPGTWPGIYFKHTNFMEAKVKRSEELLNRIANRTGMTKEGRNWLIKAVDPFHDLPVEIEGFPDGQIGESVVQTIPLSLEVSRPATVPSTDNWDCLIFMDDSPKSAQAGSTFIRRNMFYGAGITASEGTVPSGGLTTLSGPQGANLTFIPSVGNTIISSPLQVPSQALMDPCRVIAQAFEVRNVTAELFKQGDVIVFEQPLNSREYPVTCLDVDSATPTITYSAFTVKARTMPPRSQQEATTLPSSRRFEAREGCYVVGAMETLDNDPAIGAPTAKMFYDHAGSPDTPWPDDNTTVYVNGTRASSPPSANWRMINPDLITPFGRRGAYFSGLSPETTLKVNYKVVIERFPSSTSPVINFARPTPIRDHAALEAYTEILNRMPVGVPVAENGLGDWFTGAVADIIDSVTGTTFASKADKWQKEMTSPKKEKVDNREAEIDRKLKMIEEWEKSHRHSQPSLEAQRKLLQSTADRINTQQAQQRRANDQQAIQRINSNGSMKNPATTVTIPKVMNRTPLKSTPPQTVTQKSSRNPRK